MPGKGWRKAPDGTWTPPNQMRHTLQIDEETQEWLEDEVNRVVALHEATSVAKSYLGTNVGAIASTLGLVVLLLSFPQTQPAVVSFIAFIRQQIASLANDITKGIVPTPADIVEEIAGGAKDVGDKAREAAQALFDEIERRLQGEKKVEFGGAGPVGIPVDEETARRLREAGEQPPL